jgi:hypothetical protein
LKRKHATKPPTIEQRSLGRKIGSVSTTSGKLSYVMYVVPTARAAKAIMKAKKEGKNAAVTKMKWPEVKRILLQLGHKGLTIAKIEALEDELKNYINPHDYDLDSIQDVLYDIDGEAARLDIAENAGLTFEDFERISNNNN